MLNKIFSEFLIYEVVSERDEKKNKTIQKLKRISHDELEKEEKVPTTKEILYNTKLIKKGLILPKFYLLTYHLNPTNKFTFIQILNNLINSMKELNLKQEEEFKKLNIPFTEQLNGFSIEGILAVEENSGKEIFIPLSYYSSEYWDKVNSIENIFQSYFPDNNEDTNNDDVDNDSVTEKESNNNEEIDKTTEASSEVTVENNEEKKYHFSLMIQMFGYFALPKEGVKSAYYRYSSPLLKLNQLLGFRQSKL